MTFVTLLPLHDGFVEDYPVPSPLIVDGRGKDFNPVIRCYLFEKGMRSFVTIVARPAVGDIGIFLRRGIFCHKSLQCLLQTFPASNTLLPLREDPLNFLTCSFPFIDKLLLVRWPRPLLGFQYEISRVLIQQPSIFRHMTNTPLE